jgi:DNA-binding NarL/FixJ family response regulator
MPANVNDRAAGRRLARVMVVDDAPQVRQDLRLLLELSGAVVVAGEAADGQEAIIQVEALRPDIILMDLDMPVMDGYEATRQIKARWPACRVIAFSVHSHLPAREMARRAGMDGFIEKGASLAEMLQRITSCASCWDEARGQSAAGVAVSRQTLATDK